MKKTVKSELEIFRDHYRYCLDCYDIKGRGRLSNLQPYEKGDIINSGECADFVNYVLTILPKGLSKEDIKVWGWDSIHTFIVAYGMIWDARHCYKGEKYSRDAANRLFLCYASSLAFGLNGQYYIEHEDGQHAVYDPWGVIDNENYDPTSLEAIPSRETVYTVDEFLEHMKSRKSKSKKYTLEEFINSVAFN